MLTIRTVVASAVCGVFLFGCAVKPIQMTSEEQFKLTQADLSKMFADQLTVDKPISLPEAMARAVKYNLDFRVQLMDEALKRGELQVAMNGMLPSLTASAGYNERNNVAASSSVSTDSGIESLETSTSQDKDIRTKDLTLAWNILDFGVSYAQAKQQSNQVLIAQEKKIMVVQNIIQDVRFDYWRALSAQRLLPKMNNILD